jgi:hypothetical protein
MPHANRVASEKFSHELTLVYESGRIIESKETEESVANDKSFQE